MNLSKNNELVNSPLHQLELQMANARSNKSPVSPKSNNVNGMASSSNNLDRESIYSFDSVSTNGRLLDRLDLDNEDLFDYNEEFELSKRDSVISIKTSGRLLDRLGLDDDQFTKANNQFIKSNNENKYKSIIPAANLNRYPSMRNNAPLNPNVAPKKRESKVNIKNVPINIVLQNSNSSIDSFKADIIPKNNYFNTALTSGSNSSQFTNAPSASSKLVKFPQTKAEQNFQITENDEFNFSSSNESIDLTYSSSSSSPLFSKAVMRTPSAPTIKFNSHVSASASNKIPASEPILPRRVISDNTTLTAINSSSELTPESRTKLALKLRDMGKHRDASYQLQIAANIPINYPKAIFLYAMALRHGQGVKQNDRHSIKWLCKCILISTHSNSNIFVEKLNNLQPEGMLSLINKNLESDKPIDPIKLYNYYSNLPKDQISKIINISKSQSDIVSITYHELGNALINGWGLSAKDEINGINYLSKSGSMGYVNSMIQLGEIWCSKTKYHKKDYYKASAWLRLSEIFGVKSIGNSWIYKEKYMNASKK